MRPARSPRQSSKPRARRLQLKRTRMMKRRTTFRLAAFGLAALLTLASIGTALAQGQPGFGPGGMMGGRGFAGQGYGPGKMGGGGMMGGWGVTPAQAQPIRSLDEASQAFQRYIDATGNHNLALD